MGPSERQNLAALTAMGSKRLPIVYPRWKLDEISAALPQTRFGASPETHASMKPIGIPQRRSISVNRKGDGFGKDNAVEGIKMTAASEKSVAVECARPQGNLRPDVPSHHHSQFIQT